MLENCCIRGARFVDRFMFGLRETKILMVIAMVTMRVMVVVKLMTTGIIICSLSMLCSHSLL